MGKHWEATASVIVRAVRDTTGSTREATGSSGFGNFESGEGISRYFKGGGTNLYLRL